MGETARVALQDHINSIILSEIFTVNTLTKTQMYQESKLEIGERAKNAKKAYATSKRLSIPNS